MTRSKWLGIAFSATVLGGMTAWTVHTTPDVQIATALVTAGPITRRVVATGSVQAVTTVEVGSQVSGIVQSLEADYNSLVHAGQIVARLDPASYDAQLRQARAALAQAQADVLGFETGVEDAQSKLARAEALAAGRLIPQSDLDAARIATDEANADVRGGEAMVIQARAAVDQAMVNLERTIIRSPIDGIVTDRNVDVGQTLAASIQSPVLFRIAADLKHVQVQANIDESDVDGLTLAEPATFEVESYPDETFRGTLSQVRLQPVAEETTTATTVATSTASPTSTAVATVVTYAAIIDVANPDERLRPGMTAEVALGGSRRPSAVRIPNSALAFRPPPEVLLALGETDPSVSDAATVVNDTNTRSRDVWEYDGKRFTPIAVHIGLSDERWTELLSGSIRPGDALVTSAALR
jgi:HlyD family secretion protein